MSNIDHSYSIVSDVTGGGSEVDDGSGGGAADCKGVDVSHDIVPELSLFLSRHGEVYVVCVALHLLDLSVRDGQIQSLGEERGRLSAWDFRKLLEDFIYWFYNLNQNIQKPLCNHFEIR